MPRGREETSLGEWLGEGPPDRDWAPRFLLLVPQPATAGNSSLGEACRTGDRYKVDRPDFVLFSTQKDGADIVDPLGHHLGDALPKLPGLAAYAASHADAYGRIESLAEVDKKLRVLHLTRKDMRKAIATARSVLAL